MIAFLFTPVGRYVAIGIIILMAASGAYWKIRADAVAEIEAAAQADVLRRTQNALTAGDAAGTSPDKLRQSDGNARD